MRRSNGTASSATASPRPGTPTAPGGRPRACTWTKFHRSSSMRVQDCRARRRMRGMGRWDHILDQKPRGIKDYVLDKVTEQLVEDLRNFPPRIEEWLDQALEARYASVPARVARPELQTYRAAFALAREVVLREYEPIEPFCRS